MLLLRAQFCLDAAADRGGSGGAHVKAAFGSALLLRSTLYPFIALTLSSFIEGLHVKPRFDNNS